MKKIYLPLMLIATSLVQAMYIGPGAESDMKVSTGDPRFTYLSPDYTPGFVIAHDGTYGYPLIRVINDTYYVATEDGHTEPDEFCEHGPLFFLPIKDKEDLQQIIELFGKFNFFDDTNNPESIALYREVLPTDMYKKIIPLQDVGFTTCYCYPTIRSRYYGKQDQDDNVNSLSNIEEIEFEAQEPEIITPHHQKPLVQESYPSVVSSRSGSQLLEQVEEVRSIRMNQPSELNSSNNQPSYYVVPVQQQPVPSTTIDLSSSSYRSSKSISQHRKSLPYYVKVTAYTFVILSIGAIGYGIGKYIKSHSRKFEKQPAQ